jgi:beta-glucosidase
MSIQDKVGQMSQIDLNVLLVEVENRKGKKAVSAEKAEYYLGQLGVGSVFNYPSDTIWDALEWRENIKVIQDSARKYNRPPVLIGLDSIHGANYVFNSVITPQPINLAATFNPEVAYWAGKIASRETRAAGINWIFAPVLGLALQPLWARVYETFGEDPLLVSKMGKEHIRGIQEPDDGIIPSRAAACAKHFVAYSMPRTGHDRTPAWIPERHVQQYFIPSFQAAIQEANVLTVMSSYSEYDGIPMTSNRHATNRILRYQLGFRGILVTDFSEIINLQKWHMVARDNDEAVRLALTETTIDMSMIPFDVEGFQQSVFKALNGSSTASFTLGGNIVKLSSYLPPTLPVSRIDQSVRRILELKETLHMFNESVSDSVFYEIHDELGSSKDRDSALILARDSIVLVKNIDYTLPILYEKGKQKKKKIFITGPTANSLSYLSGGWTIEWQGAKTDGQFTYGTTILAAFVTDDKWIVSNSCGVDILGYDCGELSSNLGGSDGKTESSLSSIDEASFIAASADYSIICVGEQNYGEKPGDLNQDLSLPKGQYDLVRAVSNATKAHGGKVILVYIGGRPRILQDMVPASDAILIAFLPGPDGGRAIADLISGTHCPSAKLPITYPKFPSGGGAPYFHAVSDMCTVDTAADGSKTLFPHYDYALCEVEWPFGHGLSYTSFEYSNISVSKHLLSLSDNEENLTFSVLVTNTGNILGTDTVLIFSFDKSRPVTPEYKRLRAFEKVVLRPGESKTVSVSLSIDNFRFVGPHDPSHRILQQGDNAFVIGVGSDVDCRIENKTCTGLIIISSGDHYVDFCEASCNAWQRSGCIQEFSGFDATSCLKLCVHSASYENLENQWGWNYVDCIEEVGNQILAGENTCEGMVNQCRNIFVASNYYAITGRKHPTTEFWFSIMAGLIGIFIIMHGLFILPPELPKSSIQLIQPARPMS